MAGERTGSYNQLVIWKESTYNTKPTTPTGYQIPVIVGSGNLACSRGFQPTTVLQGSPNPSAPHRDFWKTQGAFGTPVASDFLGYLLNRLLGTYAVSGPDGNGKYLHVWKIGTTLPGSFGCEVWNAASGIVRGDWMHGLVVVGLSGSVQKGPQEAQLTWDVLGSGKHDFDQSTRADSAPDAFTAPYYSANAVEVYVDGTESVLIQQLDWKIEVAVEMQYILDGEIFAYTYTSARYKVSGKLTGLWDQGSTLRALATGEAEHTLKTKYLAPVANEFFQFESDETAFEVTESQPWGEDGALKATVSYEGYLGDDADASAAKLTLQNTVTTYSGL